MRSKLLVLGVVTAALIVVGCGSSKKSSSTSSTSSSASTSSTSSTSTAPAAKAKKPKKAAVPSRTYRLKLAGTAEVPKGAPSGSGSAVVTFHGKTLEVCWRFSHLHGFSSATFAHIHKGAKGAAGAIVVPLSTAPTFRHKGCVKSSSTLIKAMEKNPHAYYVNIHSKKYQGGAVRSQLELPRA
jgi:hypothetical protein